MTRILTITLFAALFFTGCQEAPKADSAKDEGTAQENKKSEAEDLQQVRSIVNREVEAINTSDADKFMSLMAEDALILPPNSPAIKGTKDIRAFVDDFFAKNEVKAEHSSSDVVVSGDIAYEVFNVILETKPKGGGDTTKTEAKGIHVLRKMKDGSWKVVHDVWNESAPPASAAKQ